MTNNIELRWSSDPDFGTYSTTLVSSDPGIYANILEVDYDFDEILKDQTLDGRAVNFSKARYSVEMSVPVFTDTFNVGLYKTLISFLLAPYKRIFPVSGRFDSPLVADFTSDNEINLITDDKDKENFNSNSGKRILKIKLKSETNTYNVL